MDDVHVPVNEQRQQQCVESRENAALVENVAASAGVAVAQMQLPQFAAHDCHMWMANMPY